VRISTRGSYALEAVVAIALFPEDQTVSIREISERTQISDNYLEQIFSLLRNNNIISSSRGAYGGYQLARKPSTISVGDVLRATEKSISPVLCAEENDKSCPRAADCVTKNAWRKLSEAINETVDSISIADLTTGFLVKNVQENADYSI
jgi:Rrf2 family protein